MPTYRVRDASLDYYAQSSSRSSWRPCPNRHGRQALVVATGVLIPATCGRLHCCVCVRAEAFRYSRAIGVVGPTQAILLTGGAMDWSTNQRKLNRFRSQVRRRVGRYEDVAHVERNPSALGTHLHLFAWGDHLDGETVRTCARLAGFGDWAGVEPIRTANGKALAYGLKVVISGSNEGPDLPGDSRDYLDLNGGRLGHATRGFWRDHDGRPVKGWREAARHWRQP